MIDKNWEDLRTGQYGGKKVEFKDLPMLSPVLTASDGVYWFNGVDYGKDLKAAEKARDIYYGKI
jgi:hypothetical protein